MLILLITIFLAVFVTIIVPIYVYYLHIKIPKEKIIFEDQHLPQESNIEYYRDIPLNHDILRTYGIAINFNIIQNKSNLIGALLLSWLKFDYIKISKSNLQYGFSLEIPSTLSFDSEVEQTLLDILIASSNNNILEFQEFESYCYTNYIDILRWFDLVDYYVEEILKSDEYIKEKTVIVSKMFNLINRLDSHKIITKKATKKAIELLGFKKYLLNYSNISDKTSAEVVLWEDYLVFAQLLGIASEVNSNFTGIYLSFDTINNIYRFSTTYWHYIKTKKIKPSNN